MRTLVLALGLALSGTAVADPGDDVLAKVDKAISNFKDQTITFDVQNLKPGTTTVQPMQFRSITKAGKNFVEFLAPGDLKGTRVLTMSATEMWIWLPEFGKIRKVATHTLAQVFMGTTLTSQDVGTTDYAKDYDATLASEDASTWTLKLEARNPEAIGFPHLRMVVDKKMNVPLKVEYLADDGTVTRTQTRSGYTCPKVGYCMFGQMKMVDHSRAGAWTVLKVSSSKVDSGISDDIFTPRSLQLGL
jgi:hypothetical protein